MSDQHIVLPSKPRIVKEEKNRGTYEIDGFYPGYGHTIGNSLRRIILSSLPGVAITHVKIEGAGHEFSTLDGVKEDMITLLLNLKKVRFVMHSTEAMKVTLEVTGPKEVTAADIDAPSQIEIFNPDQYIAEISGKKKLVVEATLQKGIGYVPKEEHTKDRVEIGTIALDAAFSPIRRVNYEVENMRVGDRTDYNRLRIFIETDGTLSPREALEKSVEIMIHQLRAIVGMKEELDVDAITDKGETAVGQTPTPKVQKEAEIDADLLKMRTDELGLSARVYEAIDEAGIRTVGGLVRKREEDLLAIQGLGQKGVQEIKKALGEKGVVLRD
jgi:DNA-directed RNA polymerase subunit alpha